MARAQSQNSAKERERHLFERTVGDVLVLGKSRQRLRLAARDAHGAVTEDALGVDHVAENLADAPLAGGVAIALAAGGHGAESSREIGDLPVQRRENVGVDHASHIVGIEGRVFVVGGRRDAGFVHARFSAR